MTIEFLTIAFDITIIIFLVGNLAGLGLQLTLADAIVPLRNPRFVLVTLVACFVFSPVFAYAVTLVIPMERPFVVGTLLIGLAPSAPYLPIVVRMARGDLAATASLLLLAAVGTVPIMAVGVPLVAANLSANPWSIAKPLLFLMLIPLAVGMLIRHQLPGLADRLYPPVKNITNIGTILLLVLALALYYKLIFGALGSGAFPAQILLAAGLAFGGYWLAAGLDRAQKTVLSLGICSRNVGAPVAVVGLGGDPRIMALLIIGIYVTVAASFVAAVWFGRKSGEAGQRHDPT